MDHPHVARQCGRVGDRAERGVDIACLHGGNRHVRVVDLEGHHVEVGFGMRPPIVVQDDGLRGAQAENVDPKGPRTRSDRGDGAVDARDDVPGVREESLAVEGQLDSSGGAGEQPDVELPLEGRDPLRHGLLRDAELVGRVLQLSDSAARTNDRTASVSMQAA
ncbi:hypothetical protein SALBM311S_04866 [Streptomyces alboniger]